MKFKVSSKVHCNWMRLVCLHISFWIIFIFFDLSLGGKLLHLVPVNLANNQKPSGAQLYATMHHK